MWKRTLALFCFLRCFVVVVVVKEEKSMRGRKRERDVS